MHGARASLSAHNSAFIPSNIMAEEQAKKTYNAPNYAKITANKTCKDTKHAKLALFAQYCYSMDGRNGHDLPNIEILIHSSSSQQAGENRLNQVFSGVRGQLKSIAGAGLIGTSMMFGSIAANADEAPRQQATATPVASRTIAPNIVDAKIKAEVSQAWQDAQDYSIDNAVISYLIIGQTDRFSNDQIRGGFAKLFTNEGNGVAFSDLKSFGAAKNLQGARIGFYIDSAQFGPYDFIEAVKQIPKLSKMFLEHKPVKLKRMEEKRKRLASLSTSPNTPTSSYE